LTTELTLMQETAEDLMNSLKFSSIVSNSNLEVDISNSCFSSFEIKWKDDDDESCPR
jgi:hypothetical protein